MVSSGGERGCSNAGGQRFLVQLSSDTLGRAAMLRLSDTIPPLANELADLLADSEHPELASQVPELEIVERCRCGDDFCSTFYTAPPPKGAWGEGHWSLPLTPESGMIMLDLVADRIVSVEVLYRPEIQRALLAALP